MTPYPHPHGTTSLVLLPYVGDTPGVFIVEETRVKLPLDKLTVLRSLAGQLDNGSGTILPSSVEWLFVRGLVQDDPLNGGRTYSLSLRGARVIELASQMEATP